MAATRPSRSRHSTIGKPNITSPFIVPGRSIWLGTAGYQKPKSGALLDDTTSGDGVWVITEQEGHKKAP